MASMEEEDFARYVSGGMVDVIQPDLTNSKGILEAKKIAAIGICPDFIIEFTT